MKPRTMADLRQELAAIKAERDTLLQLVQSAMSRGSSPPSQDDAVQETMVQLQHMTLKQHAVLTATMGGVSYKDIANLMMVDDTTVKLHLRAALGKLGMATRDQLMLNWRERFDAIPDSEYVKRFGISKKWHLRPSKALLEMLHKKRSSTFGGH